MKHNWEYRPFAKILKTITPTSKIEKSEYQTRGLYPIISQEDVFISGFWDNSDDITRHSTPVVIFGDHSRVLKYIDFEFVVGADGVKIIQPIGSLNAKFLYHFLKWYNVPSLGYSRHFKLLKDVNYPLPPMETQAQIVAELDQIKDLIAKNRELLSQLDALTQSLFFDIFGDPISNPKGWDVSKIGAISSVQTGATPSREIEANFCGEIPWVKTTEVQNCNILNTEEHISDDAMENSNCKIFPIDTILVAMYGQGKTRGQIARLKIKACTNQACAAILPSNTLHPSFLFSFLLASYEPLRSVAIGCNQKNLNLSLIKNYPVILPPLALQEDFAAKVEAIEAQKAKVEAEIAELQTLLDARMDYWFN